MRKLSLVILMSFIAALAVSLAGCGSDGGGGQYACSYEERRTDGCDGYGFGSWTEECFTFNADDYYISPEQVCANVTSSGLECTSTCCVDFDFQNVQLTSGSCP